jgi:protein SCO1/2
MSRVLLIPVVAALSLLLGIGFWYWQSLRPAAPVANHAGAATVLSEPRPIPAFALTDHKGRTFGPAQLRGQWSLIFFGFTRCPDICPNTLGLLQAVNSALGQTGAAPLQIVFISVDPKYDNTEALKSYVEYFDPAFVAATGAERELQKLTGALYMPYTYVPTGRNGDYTVEHSGSLVLLNPQVQAMAYFSPPLQLRPIVNDLRKLLQG